MFRKLIGKISTYFSGGKPTQGTPSGPDQRTPGAADDWLYSGSWLLVGSSNVEEIRYIHDRQILEVRYLNGRTYQYFNVPVHIAGEFYNSNSPGRAQWNILRAGSFPYVELVGLRKRPIKKPQVVRQLTAEERRQHNL